MVTGVKGIPHFRKPALTDAEKAHIIDTLTGTRSADQQKACSLLKAVLQTYGCKSEVVRKHAMCALRRLGQEWQEAVLQDTLRARGLTEAEQLDFIGSLGASISADPTKARSLLGIALLFGERGEVRRSAMSLLGELGDRESVAKITAVLDGGGPDVLDGGGPFDSNDILGAALELAGLGQEHERVVEKLVHFLGSCRLSDKKDAAIALAKCDWTPTCDSQEIDYQIGLGKYEDAARHGGAAVRHLVPALRKEHGYRISTNAEADDVIDALVGIGEPAVDGILEALRTTTTYTEEYRGTPGQDLSPDQYATIHDTFCDYDFPRLISALRRIGTQKAMAALRDLAAGSPVRGLSAEAAEAIRRARG